MDLEWVGMKAGSECLKISSQGCAHQCAYCTGGRAILRRVHLHIIQQQMEGQPWRALHERLRGRGPGVQDEVHTLAHRVDGVEGRSGRSLATFP